MRQVMRNVSAWAVEQFYLRFSQLGKFHPAWNPMTHDVEVISHVPYLPSGSHFHMLDVYRLQRMQKQAPVVLYIHGGGFSMLSKESHWIMALMFARAGYVVFNINYTLSTSAPFPAAVEDSLSALKFVLENADVYGGSAEEIIVAGESAGANLALSVALSACHSNVSNSLANEIYSLKPKIKALMLGCGLYEVGNIERFRGKIPDIFLPILEHISETYLGSSLIGQRPLADPLSFLESSEKLMREMPSVFLFCGGSDPILEDTCRLQNAFKSRKINSTLKIYPDRHHAFHAFVPIDQVARNCWQDQIEFLEKLF